MRCQWWWWCTLVALITVLPSACTLRSGTIHTRGTVPTSDTVISSGTIHTSGIDPTIGIDPTSDIIPISVNVITRGIILTANTIQTSDTVQTSDTIHPSDIIRTSDTIHPSDTIHTRGTDPTNGAHVPTKTIDFSSTVNATPEGGLDVQNLSCISLNWSELFCSWNLLCGDSCKITTTLITSSTESTFGPSGECNCRVVGPQQLITASSCSCPETCCWWGTGPYTAVDREVTLAFNITDNGAVLGQHNHTIDNYAIVVPAKVKEVKVTSYNGTRSVDVSWRLPAPMSTYSKQVGIWARIDHRLADSRPQPLWILGDAIWCNTSCLYGEQAVELEAWWHRYELRVRLRSGAALYTQEEDGFWSAWNFYTVTTPPAG